MSAPPPVGASTSAEGEKVGGGRRFSLSSVVGSLSASVVDVRAGATRLASSVFDNKPGAVDEYPAVLLEPEPETLVGWESRAKSLEAHWRAAVDQVQALRTRCAAQEERIAALQAQADLAQAYAAQVSALEDEIGILNRNEQALRQVLAEHTTGYEQGEIIKLLHGELRDIQVELRAVAKQSRASRELEETRQTAEVAATAVIISSPGGDASHPTDDTAPVIRTEGTLATTPDYASREADRLRATGASRSQATASIRATVPAPIVSE